jgi:hypothetical protein
LPYQPPGETVLWEFQCSDEEHGAFDVWGVVYEGKFFPDENETGRCPACERRGEPVGEREAFD